MEGMEDGIEVVEVGKRVRGFKGLEVGEGVVGFKEGEHESEKEVSSLAHLQVFGSFFKGSISHNKLDGVNTSMVESKKHCEHGTRLPSHVKVVLSNS